MNAIVHIIGVRASVGNSSGLDATLVALQSGLHRRGRPIALRRAGADTMAAQRMLGHAVAARALDWCGHLEDGDLISVGGAPGKAIDSTAVSPRYPAAEERQRKLAKSGS